MAEPKSRVQRQIFAFGLYRHFMASSCDDLYPARQAIQLRQPRDRPGSASGSLRASSERAKSSLPLSQEGRCLFARSGVRERTTPDSSFARIHLSVITPVPPAPSGSVGRSRSLHGLRANEKSPYEHEGRSHADGDDGGGWACTRRCGRTNCSGEPVTGVS